MSVDATVALVSLANVKTFLKITASSEDTLLETLINNMSAEAAKYCGRTFVQATFTEFYDGDDSDTLRLRNYPVVSLTSLNIDSARTFGTDSLVDVSNIQLNKGAGMVSVWNSWGKIPCGVGNVKVVYSAGYATIPYDLQHACMLMVMYAYKRHYQDQRIGLTSETIGDRNMTYSNEDIPKAAKFVLDHYKKRGVATYGFAG